MLFAGTANENLPWYAIAGGMLMRTQGSEEAFAGLPNGAIVDGVAGCLSERDVADRFSESIGSNAWLGVAEREGLAHDARNLLAAVGLYCDLMSRPGVVSGEYRHYLDELQQLARRSGSLVERLMLPTEHRPTSTVDIPFDIPFDIPNHGHTEIRRYANQSSNTNGRNHELESVIAPAVSISRLLANSHEMLQVLAGDALCVEVESRLGDGVEVAFSEESLLRVLVNLTVNAREAMPQGGRLRITAQWSMDSTQSVAAGQPVVLLTVQDTGSGMPAALVSAFNQQHNRAGLQKYSVPRGRDGRVRGLGLKIVRELVTSAGGEIRILSAAVGREICTGTRFEILLPLTAAICETSAEQRASAAAVGEAHATMSGTSRTLQLVPRSSSTAGPGVRNRRPRKAVAGACAAKGRATC